MSSRWWDFGGDTIIRTDQYIRLTSDFPSQSGWLFSRIPVTATNWEVEFEFSINGKGHLHGDGFAMWITKERGQPGPVFGHADQFEGLGIFFDTYKNNRPGVVFPYVMAMVGDGKTTYDTANDGKANELAGCSARGLRGASIPTKAKLTYFQDKSLTLQLQYKAADSWIDCFSVEPTEQQPLKLPNTAYLGFSAHTGELSDNFDIISVETRNLYNPVATNAGRTAAAAARASARGRREKKSGGWGWFFFKLIFFVGLVGGGYVGYTRYKQKQRYSGFF
ncbi:lectin, mannose-binding 2 [Capronia epimyces CBS 606.96]|uniref:Lectin, mannose-binding 2 n=1 Tax=Capronia epimyces CBS 606.96 TaxID=1182542 RepID=W9YIS0_9EURO|nr:lectin, mannose-binding 2 [Capronia epimyces CBS 606.96]EXJ89575.1 lectin, mannose-binding 2 [Capronia epimyces CBS 606.96]